MKKIQAWLYVLSLGLSVVLIVNGCGSGTTTSNGVPFDPANFKELEIKGTPPDGKMSWSAIAVSKPPSESEALRGKGKELFGKACAGCHGLAGKGDGPIPKQCDMPTQPADLTAPKDSIKIRSTFLPEGSVPAPADLFRTITRGIPGTAMWSFAALPEEDRWAIVSYVQSLSPVYTNAASDPIPLPPKVPKDADVLQRGARIFTLICYNCHGTEGMGGAQPLIDMQTRKPFLGLRFAQNGGNSTLGGGSEEDIARTIMCGFHQRSMMRSFKPFIYEKDNPTPAEKAEMDRKFWGVVYYTRELMDKQSR